GRLAATRLRVVRGRGPPPRRRVDRGELAAVLSESASPVASGEEVAQLSQLLAALLGVREVERLALASEAANHDRLGANELLEPILAVAEADPGVLPTAHRDVRGQETHQHVVHVRRPDFETAGHR